MKAALASLAVWGLLLGISHSFRIQTKKGTKKALALVAGDEQSLMENNSGHNDYHHHRRNLSNSFNPWATPEDYNEELGFGKIMSRNLLLIMFQEGGNPVGYPVVFTISSRIGRGIQGDVFLVACVGVACVDSSKKCDRHLALKHFARRSSYSRNASIVEVDALRELNGKGCQYIPTLVAFGEIYGGPASLSPANVITPPDAPDLPPSSGSFRCCLGRRGHAEPTEAGNITDPHCFNGMDVVAVTPGVSFVLMSFASGSPLLTCDNLVTSKRVLNAYFNPRRDSRTVERQLLEFRDHMLKSGYLHGDLHPGNVHWDGKRITVLDFGSAKKAQASAEYTAAEEMDNFLWRMSHEHITKKGFAWKKKYSLPFLGIGLKLSDETESRLKTYEDLRMEARKWDVINEIVVK